MLYRFYGGPFDGEHEGEMKINLHEGLTLHLTSKGVTYDYEWKDGTTFVYKGVRGGERAEPQPNPIPFTKE